ncbi:MAG: glycosyltransferase family 4 protein [Pseudomonadota bacterium]
MNLGRNGEPARLCFVQTTAAGFVAHRKHIARAAVAAGMEVHLIAPDADTIKSIGFKDVVTHDLKLDRSGVEPVGELRVIAELVRLYRRIKPDVVHHIALKPVLYGALAARIARVPCVVGTVTGLGYSFIPGGVSRRVLKTVISMALRVALSGGGHTTFENPDDRDFFLKEKLVSADHSSVITGSGVDVNEFTVHVEPGGTPVVLVGTRMLWDKGLGELIVAAKALRAEGLQFRLLFAGAPDAKNPACIPEQQLLAWQNEGVIEWLGMRGDMPQLLAQCHIACLPSYREGLPVFLAEAAASGRPSVTTDVPGCRTAVLHEQTGLLVPVRESAGLADALRRLLLEPELRARLGRQARAFAEENLSGEKVSAAFLDLYGALMNEVAPKNRTGSQGRS